MSAVPGAVEPAGAAAEPIEPAGAAVLPPELDLPPEPVAALSTFRAVASDGGPWADQDLSHLVDDLWESWGQVLRGAGMSRDGLAAVVGGYRRELWLWVVGDRIWQQCASGLAGRVLRRLPAPAPAPARAAAPAP
ncbi:MAG: hypothetical protein ACRDYC_06620 [Acidimicrobiales bacterium]